jgi:hypothetical protein
MSGKLAIVFCVHHKPWLMMGTLLTLLSQEHQEADIFFAYNVGDGGRSRDSYREYRQVAAAAGDNRQLSPFDERVRAVCQLRGRKFVEIEYENDHALDSGVWYKFIRDGRWRDYDYVLFAGEGLLFADPGVLPRLVSFAERRQIHLIASGHEKRRVPRAAMMRSYQRGTPPTSMDALHDRMVQDTFGIFCRDPEFLDAFERWGSDFLPETEHHVPGVTVAGERWRRLRGSIQRTWGSPYSHPDAPWLGRAIRRVPHAIDTWASRLRLARGGTAGRIGSALVHAAGGYEACPIVNAQEIDTEGGVTFHRVDAPEWFGCTVIHLMSRSLLERFSERLDRFGLYDALELPFAGSALEVVWGMLPAWLGVDKWFTNGLHRVRKHFATYQREDYPPEIASYINRYHKGRLVVGWRGDYLKLTAWRSELGDLRQVLPADYFP